MTRIAVGTAILLIAVVFFSGCLLGGNDDGSGPSAIRRGAIVTATPPQKLPEPVEVGDAQVTGGGTQAVSPAGGGANTYVVQSGDTLFDIASKLGVPSEQRPAWVAEVLRLNGIPDASLLAAGVSLRLPVRPTVPAAARTATPSATSATRTPVAPGTPTVRPATGSGTPTTGTPVAGITPSGNTYTVVSGDTPFGIAIKLGVPDARLAEWAAQLVSLNGVDPTQIQVGQVLRLPAIPAN